MYKIIAEKDVKITSHAGAQTPLATREADL